MNVDGVLGAAMVWRDGGGSRAAAVRVPGGTLESGSLLPLWGGEQLAAGVGGEWFCVKAAGCSGVSMTAGLFWELERVVWGK